MVETLDSFISFTVIFFFFFLAAVDHISKYGTMLEKSVLLFHGAQPCVPGTSQAVSDCELHSLNHQRFLLILPGWV